MLSYGAEPNSFHELKHNKTKQLISKLVDKGYLQKLKAKIILNNKC